MADYKENHIRFGWLTYQEMMDAIANGSLNEYDICLTNDTHQEFIINSKKEPVAINSRLRIYASVESAIADINATPQTYAGEILAIRDGEKFISYIVNQFEDGTFYVSPIFREDQLDYNELQNTPIKNLDGSVTEPIRLVDLEDGWYKITGHFITPKGTEVTSIVGNYIIVEQTGINSKLIKRIASKDIYDYTITDGRVTSTKYATEKYIKDQGFATQDSVDYALAAFKVSMENFVKDYVGSTCSLLVDHMINENLDQRYAVEDDIESLFNF